MPGLSVKALRHARKIVNNDSKFRQLGNVDLTMGIKVGNPMYLIAFSGFSCHEVRKIDENEVRDTDFMIEMTADQWADFMTGCQSGRGQNLAQLDNSEHIVRARDPRKKLDFLRYHTSSQAWLEA